MLSAPDVGRSVTLAGPGRHPFEGHLELEGIAGDHLAPEARPLDPPEERQLAGITRIEENGERAELGQCLDHEHTGQRGPTRKVPGEEGLRAGQLPEPLGGVAGLDRAHRGQEEKRRSVRQDVDRLGHFHGGEVIDGRPQREALAAFLVAPRRFLAGAGNDNSATRRGGSKLDNTNGRSSPLANTWRALVGGGSPMADNGM